MNPGKYNRIIEIQQKAETGTDDYGGSVYTWSKFRDAWAAVYPMRGKDLMTAASNKAEMVVRFDVLYSAGITQSMRVVYGGKNHNITAIADIDGGFRELQIMTTVGVNEG